jgi:O-antigen ligase
MTRFALRAMQLGAIAVVLIVSTFNVFELDRFFVPKEFVLHLIAVAVALLAMRAIARTTTRVDLLLAGYLLLSALSAVLATNRWLALRALAISASGVLLFWGARELREAGLARPLLGALALAVVAAALMSLLQTYGVETALFSENRAPGGTLGNRNFVAHAGAFGLPLLLLAALGARRSGSYWLSCMGVAIVTASLVLTRSRAAWIAFAAVALFFLVAMIVSPPLRRDSRMWRRLAGVIIVAGIGVAAALLIPNTLRWRSRNPYLESMRRVADYQQGSGRGRLRQYEESLRMATHHPLLGVGPGNWAVDYPPFATPGDPSMSDTEDGMTTNPWPSSDWVASISERGLAATIFLALAFLAIIVSAARQLLAAPDAEQGLFAAALLGTIAGAGIAGLFDAVLLLAVPTFLIWTTLGALWTTEPSQRRLPRLVVIAVIAISIAGVIRSAAQTIAMEIDVTRGDRASLARAALIDPANYRLRMRLARLGNRKQRCENARAAHALYPSARAAAEASRPCGR